MKRAKWIWYFGDFESLHLKKVNFRRTQRGIPFPPFWKQSEPYSCVCFRKTVTLTREESFLVKAHGKGFVLVGSQFYPFEREITLPAGEHTVEVRVYNECGLPCIYVQGESIVSDESWACSAFDEEKPVGCNDRYTQAEDDPNIFKFAYERIVPVATEGLLNGVLYDFGQETFATLRVTQAAESFTVYFGETRQEALDVENAYLFHTFTFADIGQERGAFAFRYFFIPNDGRGEQPTLQVDYEYLPETKNKKAFFRSSNDTLNRIWELAGNTLSLNSREFFLDGIKRDRWVWSGDAYQSYFTNRYYAFDKELAKRTIIALAGKEKIIQHVNTINDYTFYWIISVYDYYMMTGELAFVERLFPRMKEFLDFCLSRLNEDGLVDAKSGDWIYIDWAEMDKIGPICAEQMLLLRSIEAFSRCAALLGEPYAEYERFAQKLKRTVNERFWDNEKGGYIDGFVSGKRKVTRHANIFAVLFDIATKEQQESILRNVFLNEEIPPICTPYFKFYELEATCRSGRYTEALQEILSYWGEMTAAGATSFWEEYKKGEPWQEQLSMYGQKYGKSLCHAWGASPIYVLGRHILGVYPTEAGYRRFCIEPHIEDLAWVDALVPVNGGEVVLSKKDGRLKVRASVAGGTLLWKGERIPLKKDEEYIVYL